MALVGFIARPPVSLFLEYWTQNFEYSVVRVFWRENEWQPVFCEAETTLLIEVQGSQLRTKRNLLEIF